MGPLLGHGQAAAGAPRRRELARAGLAGGAALALWGGWRLAAAPAARAEDRDELFALVAVEQALALAYAIARSRPGLDAGTRRLLGVLHDHERRHAEALGGLVRASQGTLPPEPRRLSDVDHYLPGLGAARGAREILAFAVGLEAVGLAAQAQALGRLTDGRAIQTVASITAAEGQHLVALRLARGREPLPEALETGTYSPRRSAPGIP
ncbi:MAG: ferritin-like domain-containing protein [Actinobacteria bacterium]|nr:MAG: ferritin-like domain-containing protein [Actinomycetota bacterium]